MTAIAGDAGAAAACAPSVGQPSSDPGPNVASPRLDWRRGYVRSIVAGDALCALAAGLVGYFVRFGDVTPDAAASFQALMVALALPVGWVSAMYLSRSYEPRYLGLGAEEFRRVVAASVWVLATFASVSWATKWDIARGFVVVALPLAAWLTLVQRYARRQVLHRQRSAGRYRSRTLVVGHRSGIAALHKQISRVPYQGLDVIGCCSPTPFASPQDGAVPVLGGLDDVVDVVLLHHVDVVAVLPSPELEGPALRRLGWALEQTTAELLVAPAITDIAGPRVAIRPVAGLPLLHVERPEFTGGRRIAKAAFDRTVALGGLIALLPVILVMALLVKLTSPGPVLYRQHRVGFSGATFTMLKFRTMVVGADRQLPQLGSLSDGNTVLFKMRVDPRVTRVGRVLRKYSLDELPQLLNVLRGEMSLVGPRPPLPSETAQYGEDMNRRFLVKPGMTGLWQISGRSDLSWEESVRIDVRYVENWSFGLDLFVLWKTIGTVRGGRGAY
jgi:exopolysaccharide biosynthesis polyprenyl glycosylphosphotransferase